MELNNMDADYYIDNNGKLDDLYQEIEGLQRFLANQGFDVNFNNDEAINGEILEPELGERLEWTDAPEGSTQVLDHGFIRLVEHMGSDSSIAESARMSYGRGTKKVNNDQGLINYLVRNHHTSPLEMGEIKVHMRLPIFVMRQLVRHRTANLNEYSGRYSEMVRLFYTPELAQIMCQGTVNKQMSGAPLPVSESEPAQDQIRQISNTAFDAYERLLNEFDVSRETARIVLPLNTYTEVVWKMDVSNLIKFLYLRDDEHAQWEIRVYAIEIAKIVEELFPFVYSAYMRERESVKLTPLQIDSLINGKVDPDLSKSETAQVEKILANHLLGLAS
ncbi:thymidylate synthase [Sulfitobacter phage phiCB2047-B]|uniref:Thymidylate synthase n=1 Tax=Sulfitobacter phage phiCB2047-B TaxID=754046 RepID=M4PRP2_9CAUD|nr:thymidylate synthase [Sulfitobacter phage phiCB2047-B]AGH07416.1 thymidylate synthase [Sulfitobacter phage phiCB2047-B]